MLEPKVVSYASTTELMISWQVPSSNGGFPVIEYKLYVENNLLVQLDPSLNYYKLSGLIFGTAYKL